MTLLRGKKQLVVVMYLSKKIIHEIDSSIY